VLRALATTIASHCISLVVVKMSFTAEIDDIDQQIAVPKI
jgi:hypothetical protein